MHSSRRVAVATTPSSTMTTPASNSGGLGGAAGDVRRGPLSPAAPIPSHPQQQSTPTSPNLTNCVILEFDRNGHTFIRSASTADVMGGIYASSRASSQSRLLPFDLGAKRAPSVQSNTSLGRGVAGSGANSPGVSYASLPVGGGQQQQLTPRGQRSPSFGAKYVQSDDDFTPQHTPRSVGGGQHQLPFSTSSLGGGFAGFASPPSPPTTGGMHGPRMSPSPAASQLGLPTLGHLQQPPSFSGPALVSMSYRAVRTNPRHGGGEHFYVVGGPRRPRSQRDGRSSTKKVGGGSGPASLRDSSPIATRPSGLFHTPSASFSSSDHDDEASNKYNHNGEVTSSPLNRNYENSHFATTGTTPLNYNMNNNQSHRHGAGGKVVVNDTLLVGGTYVGAWDPEDPDFDSDEGAELDLMREGEYPIEIAPIHTHLRSVPPTPENPHGSVAAVVQRSVGTGTPIGYFQNIRRRLRWDRRHIGGDDVQDRSRSYESYVISSFSDGDGERSAAAGGGGEEYDDDYEDYYHGSNHYDDVGAYDPEEEEERSAEQYNLPPDSPYNSRGAADSSSIYNNNNDIHHHRGSGYGAVEKSSVAKLREDYVAGGSEGVEPSSPNKVIIPPTRRRTSAGGGKEPSGYSGGEGGSSSGDAGGSPDWSNHQQLQRPSRSGGMISPPISPTIAGSNAYPTSSNVIKDGPISTAQVNHYIGVGGDHVGETTPERSPPSVGKSSTASSSRRRTNLQDVSPIGVGGEGGGRQKRGDTSSSPASLPAIKYGGGSASGSPPLTAANNNYNSEGSASVPRRLETGIVSPPQPHPSELKEVVPIYIPPPTADTTNQAAVDTNDNNPASPLTDPRHRPDDAPFHATKSGTYEPPQLIKAVKVFDGGKGKGSPDNNNGPTSKNGMDEKTKRPAEQERLDLPAAIEFYRDVCKEFLGQLKGPNNCRCRLNKNNDVDQLRLALSVTLSCSKAVQQLGAVTLTPINGMKDAATRAITTTNSTITDTIQLERKEMVPLVLETGKDIITDATYDAMLSAQESEIKVMRQSLSVQQELLAGWRLAEDGLADYCNSRSKSDARAGSAGRDLGTVSSSLTKITEDSHSHTHALLNRCMYLERILALVCGLEAQFPYGSFRLREGQPVIARLAKSYPLLLPRHPHRSGVSPTATDWFSLAPPFNEDSEAAFAAVTSYVQNRSDVLRARSPTTSSPTPSVGGLFFTALPERAVFSMLFNSYMNPSPTSSNQPSKGAADVASYVKSLERVKAALVGKQEPFAILHDVIQNKVDAALSSSSPAKTASSSQSPSPRKSLSDPERVKVALSAIAEEIAEARASSERKQSSPDPTAMEFILKYATVAGGEMMALFTSLKANIPIHPEDALSADPTVNYEQLAATVKADIEQMTYILARSNEAALNAARRSPSSLSSKSQQIVQNQPVPLDNEEMKAIATVKKEVLLDIVSVSQDYLQEALKCCRLENEVLALRQVISRVADSDVGGDNSVHQHYNDQRLHNQQLSAQIAENETFVKKKSVSYELLASELAFLRKLDQVPLYFPPSMVTLTSPECLETNPEGKFIVFHPASISHFSTQPQRSKLMKSAARFNSQVAQQCLLVLGNSLLSMSEARHNKKKQDDDTDNENKIPRFAAAVSNLQLAQETLSDAAFRAKRAIVELKSKSFKPKVRALGETTHADGYDDTATDGGAILPVEEDEKPVYLFGPDSSPLAQLQARLFIRNIQFLLDPGVIVYMKSSKSAGSGGSGPKYLRFALVLDPSSGHYSTLFLRSKSSAVDSAIQPRIPFAAMEMITMGPSVKVPKDHLAEESGADSDELATTMIGGGEDGASEPAATVFKMQVMRVHFDSEALRSVSTDAAAARVLGESIAHPLPKAHRMDIYFPNVSTFRQWSDVFHTMLINKTHLRNLQL